MAQTTSPRSFHVRLGERLKERRITQARLAKNLGVSENTVSGWTTGLHSPKAVVLPNIARELKTSVGDLFGEEHQPPPSQDAPSGRGDSAALELVRRLAALGLSEHLERLGPAVPDLLEILRLAERLLEE
jgi:transcriptional regulator with XRE-family HTH domain